MTTERWRRIEAIFEHAAGLSGHERSSYLETSCGGDSELLQEVQGLLGLDGEASRFLQSGIQREAEHLAAAISDNVCGQRVGQYLICKALGRGGMGAVYLARREDDVYEKPVALKLVKRGMDTEEVVRRFRQERRILSRLDHPNIARLLDGGTAGDGRPYFVMEYVEGEPLARFAARLPLRGKLELFREVCGAVEYAHRNLVVHRDLKLGNILVTADGTPKLLDFGIAKLLTPDDTERTAADLRLLTPEYASPEQQRGGEAVTTASDVYSLGRVLAKLTGDEGTRAELRQILEMACRDEPERRYASVAQFSEDIRRYLAGLPVSARPYTLGYRVAKFVKRNRWNVGAGSVAIIGLIGTTLFAIQQARQAEFQRQAAEAARLIAQTEARRAEEQRARAVAETQRANDATGEAVREAQRAEAARAQANLQAERSRRFAAQVSADLNYRLHQLSGALETRHNLARATLASLQQLALEAPADSDIQFDLARVYLTMAMIHYHIGNNSYYRFEDALDNLDKGRDVVAALRRRDTGNVRFKALDFALSNQLGLTLVGMGRFREAADAFRKSAPSADGLGRDALQAIGYGGRAPEPRQRIAEVLFHLGDFRAAIEALPDGHLSKPAAFAATGDLNTGWRRLQYARSLPVRMGRMYASNTGSPALARHHLALISGHPLLLNRGDTGTALSMTRQNIEVFEQVLAAEPSDGNARDALSAFHAVLGALLRESSPEESVASYRTAIRFTRELLDRSRDNLTARRRLAAVHGEMALPLRKLGRMAEARESLLASSALEDFLGEPKSFTRGEWGDLELEASHRKEALVHFQAALHLAEARIIERPQDMNARRELADVFEKLGHFHESAGEARQAREWYAKSLAVWREWTKHGVSSVYNERREKAAEGLLARLDEK